MSGVNRAAHDVINSPVVRACPIKVEEEHLLTPENVGAHFGVFGSFAEAREWLPTNPRFDQAVVASEYAHSTTNRLFEHDYPVVRWLGMSLQGGASTVLDIGGCAGHYYPYASYLKMPAALDWKTVEVSEIVSIGQSLAAMSGPMALGFTSDLTVAASLEHREVWLSAGVIQYFEHSHPATLLEHCRARPKHVLLDMLPLSDDEDFVTAQNLGKGSISPVHVYNKVNFIHSIERQGYILCDAWDARGRGLHLLGHPERSCASCTGLYFLRHPWVRYE